MFFVKDIVNANILAALHNNNGIYNISAEIETRTYELYEMICSILNNHVEYKILPPRPGDIAKSCLVNKKAQKELKWSPQTRLFDGLIDTIKYFQSIELSVKK